MGLLAVAGVAPAFGNLYHHFAPASALEDETSIGLLVSILVLVYGVLRERLFNPLPVAVAEILLRLFLGRDIAHDAAGPVELAAGVEDFRSTVVNPAGVAVRADDPVLHVE